MTLQPLLRLVTTHPQLVVDHLEAYAGLLDEETGAALSTLKRRTVLGVVALVLMSVGAVLGGVALMLWAVMPTPSDRLWWVLAVVPAAPIAGALACLAFRGPGGKPFADLRKQLAADWAMFREVASHEHA
jgi:hypothetical protein